MPHTKSLQERDQGLPQANEKATLHRQLYLRAALQHSPNEKGFKNSISFHFSEFNHAKPLCSLILLALSFHLLAMSTLAQNFVEVLQDSTPYNFSTTNGVPLSGTVGTPAGSDGRIPTGGGGTTLNQVTLNQFQSVVSFGGLVRPSKPSALNSGLSFSANAVATGLPVAMNNGGVALVLKSSLVGAPFHSRPVSFKLGAVIPAPSVDENSNPLTNVLPSSYWFPEPHSTNSHAGAPYYWSRHAKAVFAIQPGPVDITWKKVIPSVHLGADRPADFAANPSSYFVDGPNYFKLLKVRYIASGSAIKPPQLMYWTEGVFRNLGKPVAVPTGISSVNVVYNNNFPAKVAQPFVAEGQSFITAQTNLLQELRTLWYDDAQNTILAYNSEGRVFVEFLGDTRPDQTKQHLGFEIVDVIRQPNPQDITTELGDRLNAFRDGRNDSSLFPEAILRTGPSFTYQQPIQGRNQLTFYATRETVQQSDVILHWMREGVVGTRWPSRFVRYRQVWPADVARYNHYVRPEVSNEAAAQLTAIPLPHDNVPLIEYQDALDRPRAKLTDKFEFYTFLDVKQPAHRTLLRFTAGENIAFERVFSWLDRNLKTPSLLGNSVATNLTSWDPANNQFNWTNSVATAPRVISQTINVGNRIVAPAGEAGSTGSYLAGYILQNKGNAFHPAAYVDPFANGFTAANLGSIIPVNAIPGANSLEVWWFRRAPADLNKGFLNTFWPSVIGQYTIQWPSNPQEIILASNAGSGGLGSLEAKGSIYAQKEPALPGYNPNEEHALMLGGQAYALREDLNITTTNGYSSEPFVLLDYTGADGRPSMTTFKVLREKPDAGILFDYISEAGKLLQAPMPLPFLPPPVERISGVGLTNYNTETSTNTGDLPPNWDPARDTSLSNAHLAHYRQFTHRDRKNGFWVYRGLHAGLPPLEAGTYDPATKTIQPLTNATAVVNQPFALQLHVSRQPQTLVMTSVDSLPPGLTINQLMLEGIPATEGTNTVALRITDPGEGISVTNQLTLNINTNGTVAGQGSLVITSTNQFAGTNVSYVHRPPYLAQSPAPTNSFTMRFYYKSQAGFDWPGISNPPPVDSIVPYLLPRDSAGLPIGDPTIKTTAALDIVYRPTWPATAPVLAPGQTLMVPTAGLPDIRSQTSLRVLYQQSIGTNFNTKTPAVRLHDSTREKSYDVSLNSLNRIPAGVRTDSFQGLNFFPNLPPHLAQRFFFDPNRGTVGHLVFHGEFKNDLFGEKYVLLNVLGASDLATFKALCPTGDPDKTKWDQAIDGLAATVETFREDPNVPGTYIPDPVLTQTVGATNLVEVIDSDTAVNSYALSASGPGSGFVTLIAGNGAAFTPAGDPVSLHIVRVTGPLYLGELKVLLSANPLNELLTLQHTGDLGARTAEYEYDWRIAPPVDGFPVPITPQMTGWQSLVSTNLDVPRFTLGGTAGIQVLVDNYVTMRYRPANPSHPLFGQWSAFTPPQLAEGWIKRVLAGINPFNQRVTDLFANSVNTDASILTQAGKRWEGAVALNLDSINQFGLIEIYETVLRRGKALSIDAGINFGPANDALLLAAGYLNDLYMIHGNEAFADAANPTIGISTKDDTFGDVATALFAFKGQTASLLEEELALLRGRDEFLQPGTEVSPVYNRLVWNYTRGINSGEVIYALNYDILDQDRDGVVGPADAAHLFPQGHGDAYGHYLTAMKGYYSLLMNPNFDWVPRIEAVTVLGKPISVDYQDERKFAAAAAAVSRVGRQTFDLTWRKDYKSGKGNGWQHMEATRSSAKRTRYWGMDHWASRTGQGAYINWIVGNAILPPIDPDPTHEGIQKVDRTTVPELQELPVLVDSLQTDLDNAEGGSTPLGLPETSIAFDLNPDILVSSETETHFEQVNERAKTALRNALVAFDEAKDVTRLMRSEQDSLNDFQAGVLAQELSFTNALINIYGVPYPDDVGPGKTYKQGYTGPDLLHYMYVETVEREFGGLVSAGQFNRTHKVDIQDLPATWWTNILDLPVTAVNTLVDSFNQTTYTTNHFIEFNIGAHGFSKPTSWTGRRASPGRLQQAASEVMMAHQNLLQAVRDAEAEKQFFDKQVLLLKAQIRNFNDIRAIEEGHLAANAIVTAALGAQEILEGILDEGGDIARRANEAIITFLPRSIIAGVAAGGDLTAPARGGIKTVGGIVESALKATETIRAAVVVGLDTANQISVAADEFHRIAPKEWDSELKEMVIDVAAGVETVKGMLPPINEKLRLVDDAWRNYRTLLGEGERLQLERQVTRERSAAIIQGYRTRDAAFRLFRNEKLDRYKALFDLAAEYTFMAAQAYDYETGLLSTPTGREFINRIINSRALGVMVDGEPQFAGSDTGDPGLSGVLAEMEDDWLVLKSRLGFNNPDAYGTTFSLRSENFRILPGAEGDVIWTDVLHQGRRANLLDDADVERYCLQIDPEDGLPVPGIILEFGTTIANGYNLFGRQAAAGDHGFSPAFFATKIFSAGVAFEGYKGMDNPVANGSAVSGAGGVSPTSPNLSFLDPDALFATPHIYLIPVGIDSMRSPPLGDVSNVRTWTVDDVTIPLPFNIGASDFSTKQLWQSSDSLSELLFSIRKHQPFRPVSSASAFSNTVFGEDGLARSQFTNTRLIGRSVWNSKWKIVIPGYTLLHNSDDGLDRFIRTVKDVKLHFVTYSYSGN